MIRSTLSILILIYSNSVFACSCLGTASFNEAVKNARIVVYVKIIKINRTGNSPTDIKSVKAVVLKTFKGKTKNKKISIVWSPCYHSISLSDIKLNKKYIFPFDIPIDGQYNLMGCSHSGVEVKNGKLYTYESTAEGGRKLKYFLDFSEFERKMASYKALNSQPSAAGTPKSGTF